MARPSPTPSLEGSRIRVESLEGLEETLELRGRDGRAAIGDQKNSTSRLGARRDLDPAPNDVVPDRVRDEVGGKSLEQVRIAGRPRLFERHDALERGHVVGSERFGSDRREVDRLAALQPPPAQSKRETRFEQSFLSPAGAQDTLADLTPAGHIRVRVGKCQLEQGTLGRQRRTQLMRHTGRKALPGLEHHGQVQLTG